MSSSARAANERARVVVVTVTYRSGSVLGDFLESLRAASAEPVTTIVVDNASGALERERELVSAFGAHLVELDENLGYGGGMAAGVAAAPDSRYLLIVNPDVVFSPGSIDRLVEAADRDTTIGAIGPRIENVDGTVYPSARRLPSIVSGAGHAVLSRVWPSNPWTADYRVSGEHAIVARDAGWLSGACLLVRREAWNEVGGFDPRFFMYFEDVDLGARLGDAGWRNRYEPGAMVVHTGAHSTSQSTKRMAAVHHESAYLYLSTRYPSWYHAPVRWVLRAGLGVRKRWVTR
jgi:N-acetylglucosaminyl-diphospho-decaprenol L-rhamnosyltransferase